MSFLPHEDRNRVAWVSSVGLSTLAHAGLGFLLLSSTIPFLPEFRSIPELEEEFAIVSIDMLSPVQVLEPNEADDPSEAQDELPVLTPEISESVQPDEGGQEPLQADVAEIAPQSSFEEVQPQELNAEGGETDVFESLPPEVVQTDTVEELQEAEILTVPEPEAFEPDENLPSTPTVEPAELVPEITEPDQAEVVVAEVPQDIESTILPPQDFSVEDDSFTLTEENPLAPSSGLGEFASGLPTVQPLVEETQTPEVIDSSGLLEVIDDSPVEAVPLVELPTQDQDDDRSIDFAEALPDAVSVLAEDEPSQAGEQVALLAPEEISDPAPEVTDVEQEGASDVQSSQLAGRRVLSSPSPQMQGLGQLIQQIRSAEQLQCSLLLPRRSGDIGLGLSMVGTDDVVLSRAADAVLANVDRQVTRSLEIIDARQCAVLDALRQTEAYPASRIGLALDKNILQSGDSLKVRVLGAGGLNVALMLIDDNGVVQDLTRFASIEGDEVVIDAPMARAGSLRDTQQILAVLGWRTRTEENQLNDRMGELAEDVFADLPPEVLKDALFGMATFQIE